MRLVATLYYIGFTMYIVICHIREKKNTSFKYYSLGIPDLYKKI